MRQKGERPAAGFSRGRGAAAAPGRIPGVQADARDLGYVTGLLPRGLEQSAQWADAGQYNKAAAEFNNRLNGQVNGRLARLLGVREAELFPPGGESL